MKRKNNYFILNKQSDFLAGRMHKIYAENGILTASSDKGAPQYFISKIYDAKEKGMSWNRMYLNIVSKGGFYVSVYSTDVIERTGNGKQFFVGDLLYDENLTLSQVKLKTSMYLMKTASNQNDMLLHEVRGRYLWFILEFFPSDVQPIKISRIGLHFPKDTWMKYLPEVYQQDKNSTAFLEGFLSIFQTMYEKVDEKIKYSFVNVQPDLCEKEDLIQLAKWLHVENSHIWGEEQLRHLLTHAMESYASRGTKKSLLNAVTLYIREPAYLVEQHKLSVMHRGNKRELIRRLYGTNPYQTTLLVREEKVPSEKEFRTLHEIVKDNIPAEIICQIVVLKSYIFLDQHTYLGINSVLGRYKKFELGGDVRLPFGILESKKEGVIE